MVEHEEWNSEAVQQDADEKRAATWHTLGKDMYKRMFEMSDKDDDDFYSR